MFSIIYTPTEGEAIQNFSSIFRKPDGCFLNILDQQRVHDGLSQWGFPEDIDYIVVTDGEAVRDDFNFQLQCWQGSLTKNARFWVSETKVSRAISRSCNL